MFSISTRDVPILLLSSRINSELQFQGVRRSRENQSTCVSLQPCVCRFFFRLSFGPLRDARRDRIHEYSRSRYNATYCRMQIQK